MRVLVGLVLVAVLAVACGAGAIPATPTSVATGSPSAAVASAESPSAVARSPSPSLEHTPSPAPTATPTAYQICAGELEPLLEHLQRLEDHAGRGIDSAQHLEYITRAGLLLSDVRDASVGAVPGCDAVHRAATDAVAAYRQAAADWAVCRAEPTDEAYDACFLDKVDPTWSVAFEKRQEAAAVLSRIRRGVSPVPTDRPAGTPTPSPTPTPRGVPALPVEVLESGFTQTDKAFMYGVVVRNPNSERFIASSTVVVEVLDGGGNVIGRHEDPAYVLPGARGASADSLSVSGTAAALRITVETEWEEVIYATGELFVREVELRHDRNYSAVRGLVGCNFTSDPESIIVTGIVRDAAGRILGGGWNIFDRVDCAGRRVTIRTTDALEDGVSAELYASL